MRQGLTGIRTENVGAVIQDWKPPELESDMIYVFSRLLWPLLGEETSRGHRGSWGSSQEATAVLRLVVVTAGGRGGLVRNGPI